ncbi:uncharacterized protein OCT59_021779 [Rhizophagus irregularis]|uniref:uncharacterized protein n=1 Tax=Rhizophagus irregularis TaxID=588596 RepID=UPI0019D9B3AF|nr:hypothetical protein OCT59_021779 [Rhizophagus irregularis]GET61568.1 hypothetical protein RIR_jg33767.t1 [Rhizophagus irregularis DAOM 181602=DAOM 197198]
MSCTRKLSLRKNIKKTITHRLGLNLRYMEENFVISKYINKVPYSFYENIFKKAVNVFFLFTFFVVMSNAVNAVNANCRYRICQ